MSELVVLSGAEDLTARTVQAVADAIATAVAERGAAVIAVPGGKSPVPVFHALRARDLPWDRVTVTLTDERCVAPDHPASNAGLVRRELLAERAAAASFLPLVLTGEDPDAEALAAEARLDAVGDTLDLVWLGMGADGHTASLFPSARLDAAADPAGIRRCVALTPESLPPEAPYPRVTLTLTGLTRARTVLITASGAAKREALDRALDPGPLREAPVRAVLHQARAPVTVFWSP